MMYWIQEECRTVLAEETTFATGVPAPGTPAAKQRRTKALMYSCISGFAEADKICRRAGRYFTDEEHADFCRWLELALMSCNKLAAESMEAGKRLFKLLPEFHALTHYYDTRLNPRRAACYQDEDMVGRMKKIYVNTHGSTAPRRGLQRYHILIGIRWNEMLTSLRQNYE